MNFFRRELKTILTAMVTALVFAGGPALAHGVEHALFAHNSDKTDGKHAVGSGATTAQAAGKLVATNPSGANAGKISPKFLPKVNDANELDGRDSSEYLGDTVTVVVSGTAGNGSFDTAIANCPAGYTAVGGGVDPNNVFTMQVTSSNPMIGETRTLLTPDGQQGAATGWYGGVVNNSGSTAAFKVAAICSRS